MGFGTSAKFWTAVFLGILVVFEVFLVWAGKALISETRKREALRKYWIDAIRRR